MRSLNDSTEKSAPWRVENDGMTTDESFLSQALRYVTHISALDVPTASAGLALPRLNR